MGHKSNSSLTKVKVNTDCFCELEKTFQYQIFPNRKSAVPLDKDFLCNMTINFVGYSILLLAKYVNQWSGVEESFMHAGLRSDNSLMQSSWVTDDEQHI